MLSGDPDGPWKRCELLDGVDSKKLDPTLKNRNSAKKVILRGRMAFCSASSVGRCLAFANGPRR